MPSSDAVAAMPPLPTEDPSSKFFWDGARQNQLMILRCQACGHFIHLPRPVCRYCLSGDLIAEQVSGNGCVYSYTVARQAFHPWFADRLPYVIAVIELVEEPELRILSNVIGCSPEDVDIGVDVEVVFQPVTNEVTLPMFQLRRV